jgi:hypothetical protein
VVLLAAWTMAAATRVDVDQVMKDFDLSADAAARIRNGEMVESEPTESSETDTAPIWQTGWTAWRPTRAVTGSANRPTSCARPPTLRRS